MIGVLAKLTIQSGTNLKFEDTIRKMREAVSKNEAGNIYYDVYKGEDENTYIVMERYEERTDLDAHNKTVHFKSIGAELGKFLSAAPDIKILDSI
jgi:quinol monooxygenase YgiN